MVIQRILKWILLEILLEPINPLIPLNHEGPTSNSHVVKNINSTIFALLGDTPYLCRFKKKIICIYIYQNLNNPYSLNIFMFVSPNKTNFYLFVVSLVEFNAYMFSVFFFKT